MKKSPGNKKVGIGWYSKNEWFKLSAIAPDAGNLEKSYEEWLEAFQKGCRELLRAGITPVQVPVQVPDLAEWCRKRNLPVDADARSKYIAEQLRSRPGGNRESVKEALFEAIEHQMREDNPKETRQTLERLVREGCSRNEAMRLIAGVLVQEMGGVLRTNEPFNRKRYVDSLKALRRMGV